MGSFEQFTKSVVEKLLSAEYAHLKNAAVVYASVSGVRKLTETYELTDLQFTNQDSSQSFRASCAAPYYEYTLRVVDRFGAVDPSFPPLPGVRSRLQLAPGAKVGIGLAFGELAPIIIGEVFL